MMVKKENSWYMCEGDWLYHFQTSTTAYNLQRKKTYVYQIFAHHSEQDTYTIILGWIYLWCDVYEKWTA